MFFPWAPQRRVWLCLFNFLLQVFAYTDSIPSLLCSRLSSPSSPSLSPSMSCSSSFIVSVPLPRTHSSMAMALLYWGASAGPSLPDVPHQCALGGRSTSCDLLTVQETHGLALFGHTAASWTAQRPSGCSGSSPRAALQHQPVLLHSSFLPRHRALHLLAHFSSLPRSL